MRSLVFTDLLFDFLFACLIYRCIQPTTNYRLWRCHVLSNLDHIKKNSLMMERNYISMLNYLSVSSINNKCLTFYLCNFSSSSDLILQKISFNMNEDDLDQQSASFEEVCDEDYPILGDDKIELFVKELKTAIGDRLTR